MDITELYSVQLNENLEMWSNINEIAQHLNKLLLKVPQGFQQGWKPRTL